MQEVECILYVADQQKSKDFYERLLRDAPVLNVPGMTEFQLTKNVKLGLMPEDGSAKVLSNKMPHPSQGRGIPCCELYLRVENAGEYLIRAIKFGATKISGLQDRNWGEKVGYISDFDGNVIAFAEKSK